MNLFKSKFAKVFVGVATLAIALAFVVTPVTSKAQTVEEQIAALLAQIAMLQAQMGGGSTAGSSYTFNNDLTIGSTGSDVVALQTKLEEAGFLTMPSGVAKGYFGSLTKSAVASWQASVGLPNTGFFGPMSRAKLNATSGGGTTGGSFPAGCTSSTGFSSTTGMPCSGGGSFPAGCTSSAGFSTTTGQPCSGGSNMNGTDGSVTLSYVSYAPASQTLSKGDMNKPVVSVKLQAVNGEVRVTRFDVHFSERPWLTLSKLTLVDSTGAVLATKTLSGAGDATEVTVGTDYLVRFDNVNVSVMPGSDKILAVAVDVHASSDKITGQTIYVGIPSGSIRTINGRGYTDSIGLSSGQGSGVTNGTGNAVTLSTSGSTGTLYTRIDPSAPATDRTIVTSASQTTPNVVLGVFGIKSQNQSGTLNGMSLTFADGNGPLIGNVYSNLRVQAGGLTYGSNALATTTTFTNMSIPLTEDAWIPLTVIADVQAGVPNGTKASTTLVASALVGVDQNFNTLTLSSASNQVSTNNIYSTSGVTVTPGAASLSNCGSSYANGPADNCSMMMSFTVTNVGNTDVFISKIPSIALATSSSPSTASTTLSSISIAAGPGDTTTSYSIPAQGTRTFTYSGRFGRPAGLGFESFNITGVRFGTVTTDGQAVAGLDNTNVAASTNAASVINFGLEPLRVTY